MYLNDSMDHLMIWLNQEAKADSSCPKPSQTNLLLSITHILRKIDFVLPEHPSLEVVATAIQQNLESFSCKRFTRSFRAGLMEDQSYETLLKVTLFMCLQCAGKFAFINRIFELPSDTQERLMLSIKSVDHGLDSMLEFEFVEIMQRVQQLQSENKHLKGQLREVQTQNQTLEDVYHELTDREKALERQAAQNAKEKMNFLESMKLNESKDYLAVYRGLNAEQQQLWLQLRQLEKNQNELNATCTDLEARVSQDQEIIAFLDDQLAHYEEVKTELNQELYKHKPKPTKKTKKNERKELNELTDFLNVNSSVFRSPTMRSKSPTDYFNEVENSEGSNKRMLRQDLSKKLCSANLEVQELTNQVNEISNAVFVSEKMLWKQKALFKSLVDASHELMAGFILYE